MLYNQPPENFNAQAIVVGCFCEREGKILLVHRDDAGEDDRWGIVAGHVETGESLPGAMIREMREEISPELATEDLVYLDTVYVRNECEDWIFHMYRVSLDAEPHIVLNAENKSFTWLTPKEALAMPLVDDAAPCIERCYQIEKP